MIEEIGSIIELKSKDVAVVLCQKSSSCAHCAAEGICHTGDDSSNKSVEAHNLLGAGIGDKVKIATSTRSFLQSSFLLYIVPLIALVSGAILGQFVGQLRPESDPNLWAALSGSGLMIASFFAIRFFSRTLPKEAYMPKVVAIIDDNDAAIDHLKAHQR